MSFLFVHLLIIVVTGHHEIENVVNAVKLGADDFLYKEDLDYDLWDKKFQDTITRFEDKQENKRLKKEVAQLKTKDAKKHIFIGKSPKIIAIKDRLRLLSEVPDITVLLSGEMGVGKEVAARYLHQHGVRNEKPFNAVNLNAIPEHLVESTLFGAKKGAFTGATKDTKGYFEQSSGGILMLDEIGDISLNMQKKMLRLLQEKTFRPVGGEKDIKVDVQIIVATNKDLQKEIDKGNFREDLYYRFTYTIDIPPLRERKEDIALIAQHFLEGQSLESIITEEVNQRFLEYDWKGNIRELDSTINFMLIERKLAGKEKVDLKCLPVKIQKFNVFEISIKKIKNHINQSNLIPNTKEHSKVNRAIDLAKRELQYIENALLSKNKVKGDAAEMLGFENTDNLRYKIKTYYRKHPELFDYFPTIQLCYRRIIK